MSLSSSVVLALGVVAALLAVVRLFEVRRMLSEEESLVLTERGPLAVFAFATHYFFGIFVLGVCGTMTASSVFLEMHRHRAADVARLVVFFGLVLATLIFFV
jgi:hypothetical protein